MARDVARAVERHADTIRKYLYTSAAQWNSLLQLTSHFWAKDCEDGGDERVRTFLLACGYAAAKESGLARLTQLLTGSDQEPPPEPRIWLEAMPIPPLKREGNTHVDLALGTIGRRAKTDSGIELAAVKSPWVCFCEMKWCADISPEVRHYVHRNQLLRVIENALCFQKNGRCAEQVYVTLVTPAQLRNAPVKSRLYHYKYEEYSANRSALLWELMNVTNPEERRHEPGWFYPSSLPERVEQLTLRWVTYDDLVEQLPDSELKVDVVDFWHQAQRARPLQNV